MRDWFTPPKKGSKTYSPETEKRLLQIEIQKRKIAELVRSCPERASTFFQMQGEIDRDLLPQQDGDAIGAYCNKNGRRFSFSRQIVIEPGTVLDTIERHISGELPIRHGLLFMSQDKKSAKEIEKRYKKEEERISAEIRTMSSSPNVEDREQVVRLIAERAALRKRKKEDFDSTVFTHGIEDKNVPQHTVEAVLKNKDKRYFSPEGMPTRNGLQNINEDLFRGTEYEEILNGSLRTASVRMNNLACGTSDPYAIRDDLDTAFVRYQYSDLPQLEKIILLHLAVVQIQPFQDGNKKTTRLLLNGLLANAGYPTISAMSTDCKEYRRILCDSLESGDATEMIDYIEKMIEGRGCDVIHVLKGVEPDEYDQALRDGWKPVKKENDETEIPEETTDNVEGNGLTQTGKPGEVPPEG